MAGNTEVSQAVCNTLLGALGAMACSQATMNNFLFGNATYAILRNHLRRQSAPGPGFPGASAVQTHMTNTRMTDPEVLELRYPVRLEEFSIRSRLGRRWRVARAAMARSAVSVSSEPMQAVIVASRRSEGPFGMAEWWAGPSLANNGWTGRMGRGPF